MVSRSRGKIFINYRRADTRWAAARLYDDLARHFSKDRLFMDVDSIPPGADFVEYLHDYVDQCESLIVLIGPSWLTLTDDQGTRRIDDPDDFVTIEIKRALERGVNVIPVLIDGADPPREQDLPDGLKPLARRQALRLNHETYGQEVERVVTALGGADRGRVFRPIAVAASLAAVLVVGALAIFALWPSDGPSQTASKPAAPPAAETASAKGIVGRWTSDNQQMVWTSPERALFGRDNVRLIGTLEDRRWRGHWIRDHDGAQRCDEARDGSHYWGRADFTFDPGFESFSGRWGQCGEEPSRPWNGIRAVASERAFTSFEVNIDRPGGDYTSLRLPEADAILCQKACSEDQRCLAWTYVAPGYQEASAICWLKNTVPQATRRDVCCTSGVAYYRRPK